MLKRDFLISQRGNQEAKERFHQSNMPERQQAIEEAEEAISWFRQLIPLCERVETASEEDLPHTVTELQQKLAAYDAWDKADEDAE